MTASLANADTPINSAQTGDRNRLSRLWRSYVKPYRATLYLGFMVMLVAASIQAAYAYLVKYIIDTTTQFKDAQDSTAAAVDFAKVIIPAILILTVLSGVTMYVKNILTNKVALGTVQSLQTHMFKTTHRADFARFRREPVGNIIAHFINDIQIISRALLRAMNNMVMDIAVIIFTIAMMFYLDWFLSAIVLLVYPIAIFPIIRISKALRGNAKDAQDHIGVMTSQLNESFNGARMIKTYGLEDYEDARLSHSFKTRMQLYLNLVKNQSLVDPILEVIGGLAIAGVFVIGVYRVGSGASTAGDIAGVITALLILAPKIRALGTLNNVVQDGLSALARIFTVIDEPVTITDKPNVSDLNLSQGVITFKDVSFNYDDDRPALKDINLTIEPGKTYALVGPSGGGKSTFLNLLPRLYDVTAGHIAIDAQDIRNVSLSSLRNTMALVAQDVTVFDDSVAQNIAFGDQTANQDAIISAAKSAHAHEFIMELPQGYETRLGENGSSLSGGQRQRIAIARAFLRQAPVLLLDEATSALDAQSEAKVQTALNALTQGRTCILIAHRLSTVRKADHILVLDKGEIIEHGTHDKLVKQNGLYRRLYDLQFKGG